MCLIQNSLSALEQLTLQNTREKQKSLGWITSLEVKNQGPLLNLDPRVEVGGFRGLSTARRNNLNTCHDPVSVESPPTGTGWVEDVLTLNITDVVFGMWNVTSLVRKEGVLGSDTSAQAQIPLERLFVYLIWPWSTS